MNISRSLMIVCFIVGGHLTAQTIYVDAFKGKDGAAGTFADPLQTLQQAVQMAGNFSGTEPVTIRLGPGLYTLNDRLDLRTKNMGNDAAKFILEATVMPDDKAWKPSLMPVIQSISRNNNKRYFDHCTGVFADRANICVRGLKFTGNTNPGVDYYYPIEKDTATLNNLEISQCYFIGDRYGAVIQGAAYVEGPGIHIDHCIFYGCKNAVLAFQNQSDFSITHSIIYGAYECAVWFGGAPNSEKPFNFSNNIVTHCRFFWAAAGAHDHSYYRFDHSIICDNDNYVGMQDGRGGVGPLKAPETYQEHDVRKTGKLIFVEVQTEGFPVNYLNLAQGSDGADLKAGLFK